MIKYLVIDCPFNQENYPSLVGQELDNPPAYALCCEVRKCKAA
jgi:hypothetical protein